MDENHAFDSVQTTGRAVSQLYPTGSPTGQHYTGYGPAAPPTLLVTQPSVRTEAMLRALDPIKPPNHLPLAILSTVLCACPCGLMSLCYAVQVDMDFEQGNTVGANYNSRQAWKWGFASIATGCAAIVITLLYFLILVSLHVAEN